MRLRSQPLRNRCTTSRSVALSAGSTLRSGRVVARAEGSAAHGGFAAVGRRVPPGLGHSARGGELKKPRIRLPSLVGLVGAAGVGLVVGRAIP